MQPGFGLKQAADEHRLEATLEFITPMFGGGVALMDPPHHKPPDGVTPVRGASLRGQLRAWWRRTCCEGLDVGTMRARERLLWGWASTQKEPAKGRVSLTIDARGLKPREVPVYERAERGGVRPVGGFGSALAYGAFPLQPSQGSPDGRPGVLTEWQGTFAVSLALSELGTAHARRVAEAWGLPDATESQLRARLWEETTKAWFAFITFGGLGGRTRRGFGAVRVCAGAGQDATLSGVLDQLGWKGRVAVQDQRFVSGKAALEAGLGKLMTFRQGREVGRNPGQEPNRPGRSRWPEPDEIRRQFRKADPRHQDPIVHVRKAPRAAFGLPIIFHFKDRADPGDTQLKPRGRERLASPLVLRPVADSGEKPFRAVALRLPSDAGLDDLLRDLVFTDDTRGVSGLLTPDEAASIRPLADQGLRGLSGADAVLNAFLAYFKQT